MSQRLTEAVAAMQKPRIIGWHRGVPVWSIAGGQPDDGNGGSGGGSGDTGSQGGTGGAGDGSTGSGSGGEGSGTGSEGQGGTEGGEGQGKSGDGGAVTRAEYDALMARMQAADRNKSAVEAKLKEYQDRDKTELEKAQDEAKTASETLKVKDSVIKSQAVKLAFVTEASHITWHDPSVVLELAMKELSDLEVSDDGTVDPKRVKAAADKLAKDKPYLVKANTSGGGSGQQQGGGSGGQHGASGAASGNGSGGRDQAGADKERLVSKFPALRR